jgi:cellulose synthase/poly-beta-1,6-N-acetylglucosamine synthase-like glycosyltransferase
LSSQTLSRNAVRVDELGSPIAYDWDNEIPVATIPYFVLSPSTILSLSGIVRGPDPVEATPAEDWCGAKIDVVIPALNEAVNIVLCLASVLHQTVRPRRICLIDDGSTDGRRKCLEMTE